MQVNALWTGREYYSLENCLINTTTEGAGISSTIVGQYQDALYLVDYTIKTNPQWETMFLEIRYRHSDHEGHWLLESDGKGNWAINGKEAGQLKGCMDVDIPLTPFTNTLPINRLHLKEKEAYEILVVYCDILEQQIKPVHQKYIRLADGIYHYENIPNDFEADILVDEWGLVIDYPALFVRTSLRVANYKEV